MTDEPKRRRSRAVRLVLVGVAGTTAATLAGGCSRVTYQRNVYAAPADCTADYSLATCTSKGQPGAGHFLGPVYRLVGGVPQACRPEDPGGGPAINSRKLSTQIDRSGFGVSCNRRRTTTSSGNRTGFWGG